ncbi:MAG: hypothetical protein ACI9ND_003220, partial [Yoonia sp.]
EFDPILGSERSGRSYERSQKAKHDVTGADGTASRSRRVNDNDRCFWDDWGKAASVCSNTRNSDNSCGSESSCEAHVCTPIKCTYVDDHRFSIHRARVTQVIKWFVGRTQGFLLAHNGT